MDLDGVFHGQHVSFLECAELTLEPRLVGRHDLIGHGLAAVSANAHHGFAGIRPPCVAGQRHDHDPSQVSVGRVVAHDHGGLRFAYFSSDGRTEFDPPNLTAID